VRRYQEIQLLVSALTIGEKSDKREALKYGEQTILKYKTTPKWGGFI